jgi:circadian clock protein KaiC
LISKRIVSLIKKYHLTAIITLQTTNSAELTITNTDISSLFHNLIILRYVEAKSKIKRSIIILKMRGSYHDNSILEYIISENGLKIIGIMNNNYEGISSEKTQRVYNESEKKMEDK